VIFYDFEVFKYDWLVVFKNTIDRSTTIICNDSNKLKQFYEQHKNDIWCGFNSRHYDQYILKAILLDFDPYDVSHHIIVKKQPGWSYSKLFNQIQLFNYDVMTDRYYGLKQLEGFMGSNIKESSVPFNIDRKLTPAELQEVIEYCQHDVEQTMEVFLNRIEEFESHMALIKMFNLPLSYLNKTKAQITAAILDAHKIERDDEFDLILPDTLQIKKYRHIVDWYLNPENRDYSKQLDVEVAGVPHTFAWGGLHGARNNYHGSGIFLAVDVASYYPALMIEYGFLSRNVADPEKYRKIRDERLRLKAEKNPMANPLKIVLNSTYGAMKDKYNPLYDPRQANNVCVGGQLLLLDLIEHLEPVCELIQSNTDGLIVKVRRRRDIDRIKEVCREWEQRTRMILEFDEYERIWQKDVNNYLMVKADGTYKSKGAYVKALNTLDYDMAIVNKAIVDYFINNVDPEVTINKAERLIDFQLIRKVSDKYLYAMHGDKRLSERILRVFASRSKSDPPVYKVKEVEGKQRIEKIANTPERCFIENGDITNKEVPRKLDRQWYVNIANKRIADFLGK